jgi:mannose-6-phosphate isomerase-like protein (cupin superfamily)
MSVMTEPIDVPVDERLRWFVGTLNRIVATGADTGGTLGVMEQWAPRGFSPPRHVHEREDSALHVLTGELVVERGDERFTIGAGQCGFLPRNVPHSFLVCSDGAHFLEYVMPGGFEQFHVDASDPAPRATLPPPGPPDVARLVAAAVPYGTTILGPPMTS